MAAKKKRRRKSSRIVKMRVVGRCFKRADGTKVCLKSKRRKKSRRKGRRN